VEAENINILLLLLFKPQHETQVYYITCLHSRYCNDSCYLYYYYYYYHWTGNLGFSSGYTPAISNCRTLVLKSPNSKLQFMFKSFKDLCIWVATVVATTRVMKVLFTFTYLTEILK
jgi:hypothetical protein